MTPVEGLQGCWGAWGGRVHHRWIYPPWALCGVHWRETEVGRGWDPSGRRGHTRLGLALWGRARPGQEEQHGGRLQGEAFFGVPTGSPVLPLPMFVWTPCPQSLETLVTIR